MSAVDVYNTQTAVALLRQHIDYCHWYDKAKLTLKDIGGTQVMWTAVCLSQLFALNYCLPSTVCPETNLTTYSRPFQRQPSEGARFLPGEGGAAQSHHDEDEPAAGPERAHAEGEEHAVER